MVNIKVLLLKDLYPGQIKILESEVKDFDLQKINQVSPNLLSPAERFLIHLGRYFELTQIIFNSEFHQRTWEKKFFPEKPKSIDKIVQKVKPLTKVGFFSSPDLYRIIAKQILFYKPDIVLNTGAEVVDPSFFKLMKSFVNFKAVGYHGATPLSIDISTYDFFFSPFLPNVMKARRYGVMAEFIPFGVDKEEVLSVLNELKDEKNKRYDIVFSGSLHRVHMSRKILMEMIADEFGDRFHLFTQSDYALTPSLEKVYRGKVFGRENLRTLALSKIAINHHGDILPWAHNFRLYEATAVGALLITDDLPGLRDLFRVGKEVIAYSNHRECVELIRKYLLHDDEREEIAKAGQNRTLREHTYHNRLEKLVSCLTNIL